MIKDLKSRLTGYARKSVLVNVLVHFTVAQGLGQRPVSFIDWEKIDNQEKELGRFTGKPREKIVEVKDMMKIIED